MANDTKEKLGIPSNGLLYQYLKKGQNASREFHKTERFLKNVFERKVIKEAPELFDQNMSLQFINYGDTQQVYVLSANDKQWSVLVTQPGADFGIGKKEYDNLRRLAINKPNLIVKPEYYFTNGYKELYIAPYIYQADVLLVKNMDMEFMYPNLFIGLKPFHKILERMLISV